MTLHVSSHTQRYVVAFDTANEVIALGIGVLDVQTKTIQCVHSETTCAHRASNTRLIPIIDCALSRLGITREQLACVVCGRGPGSFTGVRIALATAKGMAHALGVALVGVSTLDAIAWGVWDANVRGNGAVVADAMRHEVYPVCFTLDNTGAHRLQADSVVPATQAATHLHAPLDFITGDALNKYGELFAPCAPALNQELWAPSGRGLLLAAQDAWQQGEIDPLDATRHNPAFVLPVYTRLSDAEENERMVLPKRPTKNLKTGVQGESITYKPLDASNIEAVRMWDKNAHCEQALLRATTSKTTLAWLALESGALLGFVLGRVREGVLEIERLFVGGVAVSEAVAPQTATPQTATPQTATPQTALPAAPLASTHVIQQTLLAHLAHDARDLGATSYCFAQHSSTRKPLEQLLRNRDVAGMDLQMGSNAAASQLAVKNYPLIFAIESSCDETAAALVNGKGEIVASVVASQIDFHARFGGVVPEIASRKHIEALCGVCDACFEQAAQNLNVPHLSWCDMSAVAVTYAPGLVGALVVGVAFAKGAAWAANKPFIGVNHLEGHLYANKIGAPDVHPPLVASLVSGGNTMLVHVKDWGNYTTLGTTLDDAVGEAFDKVAKALGLGYPGGPAISSYAARGNASAIAFPRAMLHSGDLQFSLSGLKTAVITYIHQEEDAGRELNIPDIAASFQAAVIDVQVAKAKTALEQTGVKEFCLGGGVAANPALRKAYTTMCAEMGVRLTLPPLSVCGDNAAMIALVALDRYRQSKFFDLSCDAHAHANLDNPY